MKHLASLLSFILGALLVAQEPGKTQHPAVTTLIAWAESHQKDSEKEKVEIFTPDEKKMMKALGKGGEVEEEMIAVFSSKKGKLSFKATPGNPSTGMIFLDDRRFLPMKQTEGKWMGDLVAMMEGVKASASTRIAEQDILSFESLLEMYKNLAGHYPSAKQGLQAFVKRPTVSPIPRRWVQTLKSEKALIDPWGNPYQYQQVEGKPTITSRGPDGKVSEDDIPAR